MDKDKKNKIPIRNISSSSSAHPHDSLQHAKQTDELSKVVETYAEDMVRVIQDDQEGLIKKIIQDPNPILHKKTLPITD